MCSLFRRSHECERAMAITLAEKQRGQGKRLRVPAGELPINTQVFFFFFPWHDGGPRMWRDGHTGRDTQNKGWTLSKLARMGMTLLRHRKGDADGARIFCFLCNLFTECDLHLLFFFFLVFWASFSFHRAWYLNEYLIDRPGIHAAQRINTNKSEGHVAVKYCTGVSDPLRVYCYINFLFFFLEGGVLLTSVAALSSGYN